MDLNLESIGNFFADLVSSNAQAAESDQQKCCADVTYLGRSDGYEAVFPTRVCLTGRTDIPETKFPNAIQVAAGRACKENRLSPGFDCHGYSFLGNMTCEPIEVADNKTSIESFFAFIGKSASAIARTL